MSNVHKPNHYLGAYSLEAMTVQDNFAPYYSTKWGGMACIHFGNIIKYVLRAPRKNGIEDLKKARYILDKLIEHVEDGLE